MSDQPLDDWSEHSGRQAQAQDIIGKIQRVFARLSVDEEPPEDFEEDIEPATRTEFGPLRSDVRFADPVVENDDPAENRDWDYNDPVHRSWVRERFAETGESATDQEAMPPGFGQDGLGELARETCGDPFCLGCLECANTADIGSTCAQSVCSRCWKAWVRNRGRRKAAHLRRLRIEKNQRTPDGELTKFHHLVISAPLQWYNRLARAGFEMEEALEKTMEIVKKILEVLQGQGVVVRHSYRTANREGEPKSMDDMDEWKPILTGNDSFYGEDGAREDLVWQPHYHCVVASDWIEGGELTEKVEEATGWVIHRIADDDGVSLDSDGAMARAVTYSISHGDIVAGDGDSHNRSIIREVGTFDEDSFAANFAAKPHDLDWAEEVVEKACGRLINLASTSTECGRSLPAVDDPNQLAINVLEELFPDDPETREKFSEDYVLESIANGDIGVEVSTLLGGGGNVTVTSGSLLGADFSGLPTDRVEQLSRSATMTPSGSGSDPSEAGCEKEECDCDHAGDDAESAGDLENTRADAADAVEISDDADDDDRRCDGTMVPLSQIRRMGLLEDEEWLEQAPYAEELLEADERYPDDLPLYPEEGANFVGAASG